MKSRNIPMTRQSEIYDSFGIKTEKIEIPTLTSNREDWYKQRFYLSNSDDLVLVTGSYSFQDKQVISVAGAGDFPINFYYAGARNVLCFDISPQSCFFSELKVAALRLLSYESFVEFFYPRKYWSKHPQEEKHYSNEIYPFNVDTYKDIRDAISKQSRIFFDLAFDSRKAGDYLRITPESGIILRRGFSRAKRFNPYLASEESYFFAQKISKTKLFEFYPLSVQDYFEKFDGECDYVYISNIFSDQFDKLIQFSEKLLKTGKIRTIGITLFYPYADSDLEEELNNKEVRRRIGLGDTNWKKMSIVRGKRVIFIEDLSIEYFKSLKRIYLEITLK
ncbi:MAG: DUF3419 family protein [Candidatus Pacebacteria bacterium]|nr:DUF3419 family protein [Candidatus Paceibacterota bacterium]